MEMVEHKSISKVFTLSLRHWRPPWLCDWSRGKAIDSCSGTSTREGAMLDICKLIDLSNTHVTNMKEHRREVCNVFGGYCNSSRRMQDVDVSFVTYCPRQSPWHPTSLCRPFAPGSRKRHIIKPWDQFQRFTHWWFGVAHVQGWLEGESFSIQLSFRTIEENLADIIIQHALLCSWW